MKDVDAISPWCFADPLLIRYKRIAANLRLRVSPIPSPSPFPTKSLCTIPLLCRVPSFTSPQQPHLCSTPILCFIDSPLPSTDAWLCQYLDDPCTRLLLDKIQDAPFPIAWSIAELDSLPALYHEPACSQRIFWTNNGLCMYHTNSHSKHSPLVVIVVPRNLCLHVFRALHAALAVGHMGFYKTFHHLRLHFTFLSMRNFTAQSIKSCAAFLRI